MFITPTLYKRIVIASNNYTTQDITAEIGRREVYAILLSIPII